LGTNPLAPSALLQGIKSVLTIAGGL